MSKEEQLKGNSNPKAPGADDDLKLSIVPASQGIPWCHIQKRKARHTQRGQLALKEFKDHN